jgi:hypothetical protein
MLASKIPILGPAVFSLEYTSVRDPADPGAYRKLAALCNSVAQNRPIRETPSCRKLRPRAIRPLAFRTPRLIRPASLGVSGVGQLLWGALSMDTH